LNWHGDALTVDSNFYWNNDEDSVYSIWATSADSIYKAEISESNYSVQLCVEGHLPEHHAAIIGLEFKEIYIDD